MPIFQGFVRLRKHQLGREAVFGTAVPASRAYPFAGVPDVNLNWTDPDVSTGSIDPVAPPLRWALATLVRNGSAMCVAWVGCLTK